MSARICDAGRPAALSFVLVEQLLHAAGSGALKHVQVREYVRALVRDAEPGAPAPSERELVQQFGVARMTVRQAMDALVTEGLLERIPGRGTFVARPRRGVGRLTSFSEEMARVGHTAENQTLHARLGQAGPGVARALGITAGDAVIHWKRLRCSDGEVIAHRGRLPQRDPAARLPAGAAARAACTTSSSARGLRPTWAEDTVTADVASADEADLLGVPAGAAVLRQTRRALAGDAVVEVSRSCYRADKYTLRVQLGAEPEAAAARRARARSSGVPTSTSAGPTAAQRGDGLAGLLADPHGSGPPRSGWM